MSSDDSESASQSREVGGGETLLGGVIGGDDNPPWTDVCRRALDLGGEGVVICPLFEVVSETLGRVGVQIVEKDGFLARITVPPFVGKLLVERVSVGSVYERRLTGPGFSIDPEVVERVKGGKWALSGRGNCCGGAIVSEEDRRVELKEAREIAVEGVLADKSPVDRFLFRGRFCLRGREISIFEVARAPTIDMVFETVCSI